MSNLVVVFICLVIGLLFQRNSRLPDNFALSLNQYVIYVALPALILFEIPHLTLDRQALLPIAFAWIVMTASALFIWIIANKAGWSRSVTGALMLTVPLGNTGFLGIPLIEALLGREAIPYALLYDQFGSFLALNTYGSIVAAYYSGNVTSWKNLNRVIFTFPPFIALIISFATLSVPYPDWLAHALQRISSTLVPVVMIAVGLQWQLRLDKVVIAPLAIGLLTTLILTPLLAWGLLATLDIRGLVAQAIILEAAMPAMISASVLAVNYGLSPRLSSSIVGYGILLSLVTVWAWKQFI